MSHGKSSEKLKLINTNIILIMALAIGLSGLFFISDISSQEISDDEFCNTVTIEDIRKHVPVPDCKIESVKKFGDLCMVILNIENQLVPIVSVGNEMVIAGEIFKNKKQITQDEINRITENKITENLSKLKEASSIIYKPDNAGVKNLYMVTDPLCGYCNMAVKNIKKVLDNHGVTLNLILYSVHGEAGNNAIKKAITDKYDFKKYSEEDWSKNKQAQADSFEAKNFILKGENIAKEIGISGVPSFIFEDGRIVAGADIGKVEQFLNR